MRPLATVTTPLAGWVMAVIESDPLAQRSLFNTSTTKASELSALTLSAVAIVLAAFTVST